MGGPRRARRAGAHGRARRGCDLTATDRAERTRAADELCASALLSTLRAAQGLGPDQTPDDLGIALIAVGGYGRRELAPFSDLDLVLVHADDREIGEVASTLWYPLWDAAAKIDHSVRAESEIAEVAASDFRVALGLLDARHVAGDAALTLRVRTRLLAQWRKNARQTLPALGESVRARAERSGELGHASIPDLKESAGGLRDATVLSALVMTWLVDVPSADLERCRQQLLDVRDILHGIAGRATDRIAPEHWGSIAESLALPNAEAAQRQVRQIGRRMTHLSRLTWHRVDAVLARPSRPGSRAPSLVPVAPGVAISAREVVLDRAVDPAKDPHLLLRAAAEAAERGLVLSPSTAARLVRAGAVLPEPWGEQARNLFVRLLASGRGLLEVWETLEETGALHLFFPEWEQVRLLPHASVVHQYTVDRHMVETCVAASALIRRVSRPDLLMVAAILHDIGKASTQDHSIAGAPLAHAAALRMGFSATDADTIGSLVRWHLLLAEIATTRDPEDPDTVRLVAERVPSLEVLELLETLTEADAKATGPKAWTSWRASLIKDLARRVRWVLEGNGEAQEVPTAEELPLPEELVRNPDEVVLTVTPGSDGCQLTVVAFDRVGVMAAVAGALATLRHSVRAARAWSQGDVAISVWDVASPEVDAAVLRTRFHAIASGTTDPRARLQATAASLEPTVRWRPKASSNAAVIEVRTADRPGVLYLATRALAELGLSVRSAHASSVGPQTLDVFYVTEENGDLPSPERIQAATGALTSALG